MNKHVTLGKVPAPDGDGGQFRAVRPQNTTYALGLSVEMTAREPAYSNMAFAEWVQVLAGQIERNHYFFVIDGGDNVVGVAGWALAGHEKALAWLEQGATLDHADCGRGNCVILNTWVAGNAEVQRFMIDRGKTELNGKKLIFAKRTYPDGKMRAVKLPVSKLGEAVGAKPGGADDGKRP
ncbi:MAG: hypothetical protein ACR2PM_16440 [Hyphomicrobiales bacterium]